MRREAQQVGNVFKVAPEDTNVSVLKAKWLKCRDVRKKDVFFWGAMELNQVLSSEDVGSRVFGRFLISIL